MLAIDTALEACSAAVLTPIWRHGIVALMIAADGAWPRRSADAAHRACECEDSGLEFAQLDRIAVTTGPGGYWFARRHFLRAA